MEWFNNLSLAYKLLVIGWAIVLIWVPYVIYTNKKYHPSALFVLFFAELWERFSYYGMRALLILYMIDKGAELMYSESHAYGIYGAYGAMVYAAPLLGGLVAEKYFGYRRAIVWGGVLMALGHFTMAFPLLSSTGIASTEFFHSINEDVFFIALGLIILGNGFFKPNISSFVGTFYEEGSEKRDRGFNLFYMGINVGAFLAPITCGAIGQDPNLSLFGEAAGSNSWHYGFALAGIGMVLGLLVFIYGIKVGVFKNNGNSPNKQLLNSQALSYNFLSFLSVKNLTYIGTFLCIPLIYIVLTNSGAEDQIFKINDNKITFLDITLFTMAMYSIYYLYSYSKSISNIALDKMKVILFLFFYSTLFWAFFELAGTAFNVYAKNNVDLSLSDWGTLNPTQLQGVNPLYIILLVPVFNLIWNYLRKNNLEPSAPMKFAIGTILLGLGFFVFPIGGAYAVDGMVPMTVLLIVYLLHTLGELCLSPVGLSLVTKLAPKQVVGFVMGFWLLSSALAHLLGKFIAQETDTESLSRQEALEQFNGVFTSVGLYAVIAGILLAILSPRIKKWMHEIN